jgi:hypothetical protein
LLICCCHIRFTLQVSERVKIISPLKFFSHFKWIDCRLLLDVIEP